jgi:hypothetical protein
MFTGDNMKLTTLKENGKKLTPYGLVIAITAALVTFIAGGGDLNDVYVCPLTGDIYSFEGGLSKSGERGYPFMNTTKGYVDCKYENIRQSWLTCDQFLQHEGIEGTCQNLVAVKTEQVLTDVPVRAYREFTDNQGNHYATACIDLAHFNLQDETVKT